MYKYGLKPQYCLTFLVCGTNLDTWFSPRMAQNCISLYIIYLQLNIPSPTLFLLTLNQKFSIKKLNVFPKSAKHQTTSSLFAHKCFSNFLTSKLFPLLSYIQQSPLEKRWYITTVTKSYLKTILFILCESRESRHWEGCTYPKSVNEFVFTFVLWTCRIFWK